MSVLSAAWGDLVQQVGLKKPNDLGLFDAHGNCYTWCQEVFKAYPEGEETIDDKEDDLRVMNTLSRILRGGSFSDRPPLIRSAYRNGVVPTNRITAYGFRIARTIPMEGSTPMPLEPGTTPQTE